MDMKLNTEKSNVMVNSTSNTSANITIDDESLEELSSFKYLGATHQKMAEIGTQIATAETTRLERI